MKQSDRYLKLVEWSDEDQCYVGTCPGTMLGGVHDDEAQVYAELCTVVDEWMILSGIQPVSCSVVPLRPRHGPGSCRPMPSTRSVPGG